VDIAVDVEVLALLNEFFLWVVPGTDLVEEVELLSNYLGIKA